MFHFLLLALACSRATPPTTATTKAAATQVPANGAINAQADADSAALTAGVTAAVDFSTALTAKVKASLDVGGPPEAITICSADAPAVAATLQSERGLRLGRSSDRLRNPNNVGPDWVQAWLADQTGQPAELTPPYQAIVTDKGQRVARVIEPIAVVPLCLTCHGPPDGLAASVKSALSERYPADQATGYAVGDLRGALWVEVPVAPIAARLNAPTHAD